MKEMKDVLLYIARSELLELAGLGRCGSDALHKLKKGTQKLSSAPSADTKGTYPLTAPNPMVVDTEGMCCRKWPGSGALLTWPLLSPLLETNHLVWMVPAVGPSRDVFLFLYA